MAAEKASNCELPLPKGWVRSTSKKFNKSYYYHEKTKCSIWVHPALLHSKEDESEDEALVTTTTASSCNEEFKSLSKSDHFFSGSGGKKARSSSSIMNYLGLSESATESQTHRKGESSASFSKNQCLKRLDRKATSLLGQIQKYDETVDDVSNKESPINANEEHWSKILGQDHQHQIRSTARVAEKQANKRSLLRSHPYQKHQSQSGLYETDKSALKAANWTVNIASTNQTFISVSNEFEEKSVHLPVKPSLKPLSSPNYKENRKRCSSETITKQTEEPDNQYKIMKTVKEKKRNQNKSSKVELKLLTPAMKAVMAKREPKSEYSETKSDVNSRKEIVKSSARKIESTNKILEKSKGDDKGSRISKPTPAMLAIMKKREEREKQKKTTPDENVCDSTTDVNNDNKTTEDGEKESNKDSEGIIGKIWNKCISFRKKLKPLKPSDKMKKVFDVSQETEPSISPSKIPEGVKILQNKSTRFAAPNISPAKRLEGVKILQNKSTRFAAPNISPAKRLEGVKIVPNKSTCFPEPSISPPKSPDNDKILQNKSSHFDEVEDMDIDDVKITKGVRDLREDIIFKKPQVGETDKQCSLPTYSDPLFIVLDTNVLLSNLKFVLELRDYPIPTVGPPILMIPWMVFQELDKLKDAVKRYHVERNKDGISEKSHDLSVLARKAINLIGSCLDAEHPRVKGQSAIEAGTPMKGFAIKSNDDSIIHCALGLKTRAVRSHIVMLSNDRNLCNKAIVVGIKAFSHHNIINCLKKMFRDDSTQYPEYTTEVQSNINKSKEDSLIINSKDVRPIFSPPHSNVIKEKKTENEPVKRSKADEFSCELKCILRNDFSKIIETEMIAAYDKDLWLSIVKIKPPWTFEDTLVLFEKHWIAVFGSLVTRSLKQTITKLKDMHSVAKTCPVNNDTVKNMFQLGIVILTAFQKHSNYDGIIPKSIDKIQSYFNQLTGTCPSLGSLPNKQSECSSSKNQHPQTSLQNNTPKISLQNNTPRTCDNVAEPPVIGNCEKQLTPYEKVRLTLDEIWNTATFYSALVFSSLNFPSPLIKELDPQHAIPSVEESLLCLSVMTPCIFNLVKSIHNLISDTDTSADSQQLLLNLLESMYSFSREVMKRECTMHPDDLLVFCQDSSTKEIFIQGLGQLDRLYAMLQQCQEFQRCG